MDRGRTPVTRRGGSGSLAEWLARHDGGPYPAYRDLRGEHELDGFRVVLERVQPDPFAGPSHLCLLVPYLRTALDPAEAGRPGAVGALELGAFDAASARSVALRDYLARRVHAWLREVVPGGRRPSLAIEEPGQEILDRSSVLCTARGIEIRLRADLPGRGRRIDGRGAARVMIELPSRLVAEVLAPGVFDQRSLARHLEVVEDWMSLQEQLRSRAGSRSSPMVRSSPVARKRRSPPPLRAPGEHGATDRFRRPGGGCAGEIELPHAGRVSGLALEPGVTLLCGGGFHGRAPSCGRSPPRSPACARGRTRTGRDPAGCAIDRAEDRARHP
ncbi:MAG: ABC-ATPase domain-containing protein [Candidatus Eisenbacteria bacterium]